MEASRLNLNLGIPSTEEKLYGTRRRGIPRRREPVTLETVTRDIKLKKLAPDVEEKLIKMASSYPHGALPTFHKNMGRFIINIQRSEN